jgi:hypothetical protein
MNFLKAVSRRLMLTLVSVLVAYAAFAAVMALAGTQQLYRTWMVS